VTAPRVRFAPSPTGMLHVGNCRTALFNWLFARHEKGTMLLRIEDTDASRNHPEWVDLIYESLRWLGLDWDGEPTFQSATFDQRRATAEQLYRDGLAYYCDCTQDDIKARNAAAGIKTPGYDSFCADRGLGPADGRALRFRVPESGTVTRRDLIYGTAEIDLATIEDFIILRANGTPLYAFANALDDIDDEITHVLRGEDHLNNVVKQILIRRALDAEEPVWAHLPFIVNPGRRKLSKRRDKMGVLDFRDDGILSEAMVNYLGTLGWTPPSELGDELATLNGMVDAFDLSALNTSPAAFDEKKLLSFNAFHIRQLPQEEFVDRTLEWFRSTVVERMGPLLQERAERLPSALAMVDFVLHDEPVLDLDSWQKVMLADVDMARGVLTAAIAAYAEGEAEVEWERDSLHELTEAMATEREMKLGKFQGPIRVAVTGRRVGPPLFESLELLGRDETLTRLQRALDRLA
jgi:glutamyl-tRNA synthetase